MAEHNTGHSPETPDTPRPVSLRDSQVPSPTPTQKPPRRSALIGLTVFSFLLVGLVFSGLISSCSSDVNTEDLQATVQALVTNQSGSAEDVNEDAVRAYVYEAVGTQIAEELSADEIRDLAREVAGTQVAMNGSTGSSSGDTGDGVSREDVEDLVNEAVSTQVAALIPTNTPIPPTPTNIPLGVAEDDDAFLGPADAPVVIVEFSDFQCGFCGRWANDTLPQILEAYPDEVKFVYRDFPIFGQDSIRAAMATECAEEQAPEAFWDFHNRLFERLASETPDPLSEETLIEYAGELDLDTDAFAECLSSERYFDEIASDYRAADAWGFRGTPGFVINGVVYSIGAQPFDVFDGIIQAELAALEG